MGRACRANADGISIDLARGWFCRYNAAMAWMVYILHCADNSLYIGSTNRLEERVQKHNAGKGAKYTAGRRPVRLVYSETLPSRGEALRRELALKKLRRSQKLALIQTDVAAPKP